MTNQSVDLAGFQKFAIGQSVSRKEDPRLLRGQGRYTDDVTLPGSAHAAVRRAEVAHGRILSLDVDEARAAPGVLMVVTAAELDEAGYGRLRNTLPLKNQDGTPMRVPPRPIMAAERVLYLGEVLALVVAETPTQARDAAELIAVDYEPLDAIIDPEAALAAGAPQLHDEAPGNLALDWAFDDPVVVGKAMAGAAHVTRLELNDNRVVVAPMEPRSATAEYDANEDRFRLHVGSQGVMGMRAGIAGLMQLDPSRLQVLTYDVGGSFGMKGMPFPEYVPMLHAARVLKRPVRWLDDRSSSFLSDTHGRDALFKAALALDEDGRFLAVEVDVIGNMGAWLTQPGPMMMTLNIQKNTPGAYRTPHLYVHSRCAFTNTGPIGAYRGAGRPEGVYIMERLVDQAAREMGIDPVELRRRNLVQPAELPFSSAAGLAYDSGDYPALLEEAVAKADLAGVAARKAEAERRGLLHGFGLAYYLEVTAGPMPEMGGIRFEGDGRVTLLTGTLDYGQGHRTPFAQVLSQRLGIPFERIDVVQGDSDQLIAGGGTGGSRSIMASGTAIVRVADQVIEKGRAEAAEALEAAVQDIRFEPAGGRFVVAGTDRSIGLMELAARRPDGLSRLDAALEIKGPESAFPNGCHIAEVVIDPATGQVTLTRYAAVNDFGTLVNPMLVEGQIHGGIVQGYGQAVLEEAVYDAGGQLLSGSFMDYAMPRADDVSPFEIAFHPVPALTNPLGVKGCGEAGVSGALPTIVSAILDALAPLGIATIDMPASPERIWRAIQAVRPSRQAA